MVESRNINHPTIELTLGPVEVDRLRYAMSMMREYLAEDHRYKSLDRLIEFKLHEARQQILGPLRNTAAPRSQDDHT